MLTLPRPLPSMRAKSTSPHRTASAGLIMWRLLMKATNPCRKFQKSIWIVLRHSRCVSDIETVEVLMHLTALHRGSREKSFKLRLAFGITCVSAGTLLSIWELIVSILVHRVNRIYQACSLTASCPPTIQLNVDFLLEIPTKAPRQKKVFAIQGSVFSHTVLFPWNS